MPVAFFQIPLSVQAKRGGEAELVPPDVLQDRDYRFVAVKEGGGEGIIRLEGSAAALKSVADDEACRKLTEKQREDALAGYPALRLKQKYRTRTQPQEPDEAGAGASSFEVDEKDNPVVDTIQTVRAGFYLIDVPVWVEPADK